MLEELRQKLLQALVILKSMSSQKYLWETPAQARHSVRVICDEMGLSVTQKDLICAIIMAESGFKNTARNENKNGSGDVLSVDHGLCQINTHYHIGKGLTFPSVQYVLENPDKVVRWMIKMYKLGHLDWWIAYRSGAYEKYINQEYAKTLK